MDYIKLFDLSDKEGILKFINDEGYVVIKDVLTPEECDKTTEDVNRQIKELDSRFDIHDPGTYDYMKCHGQYGMITRHAIFSHQFLDNRQNPKIIEAFESVYEKSPKLLMNHDRFAFYRPTEHPGKEVYKTPYNYPGLHLDIDPMVYIEHHNVYDELVSKLNYDERSRDFITENNIMKHHTLPIYQGIVSIWDNQYYDGGLQLVPQFHHNFNEWYSKKKFKNGPGTESGFKFNAMDPVDMEYIHSPIRITMPAGSIAIWDKRLAHGSVPNSSSNGRIIQFMVARPYDTLPVSIINKRTKVLKKIFEKIGYMDKLQPNHIFW